jgi:hypothetical protein
VQQVELKPTKEWKEFRGKKHDGLAEFPTKTVYGVGANAFIAAAASPVALETHLMSRNDRAEQV